MKRVGVLAGLTVASPHLVVGAARDRARGPFAHPAAGRRDPGPSSDTVSPATQEHPAPAAGDEAGKANVVLVRTADRAEGVQKALQILGINPFQGKDIVLKPNFNSADPSPGSTHNDTLSALVQQLWSMGASKITVVDRSGMAVTRGAMEQKGIFRLGEELGFEALPLDEMSAAGWERFDVPDGHWSDGFFVARPVLEAACVVQTCNLKTHRFGGHFTMSLKNTIGLVAKTLPGRSYDYMHELHGSPHQRLMIAETNLAYAPSLVVLDGMEAFTSGGPDVGSQAQPGVILAATDRIAVDAVGLAILRHLGTTPEVSRGAIFEQQQIARAVELGLGVSAPEQVQIVTGDPDSESYAGQIRDVLHAS
ncbi:MAG: DUF362 domain-containing protein [Bacteroidetes bacterium]|nr:DUF362 domain-containing protein [Bacteroidota bacterium]